jgi:hypothetical protein
VSVKKNMANCETQQKIQAQKNTEAIFCN